MVNAFEIASYYAAKAAALDENDLTNLKLQKLLYFTQADYYRSNKVPLFRENIEAWDFGPVVREIYNKYSQCGAYPISYFDIDDTKIEVESDIKVFLDASWEKWNKFSASYLVSLSHRPGDPWSKHFLTTNTIIPVNELADVAA